MRALLKLRAEDADDIGVLAACLQDSLVPVGAMAFMPEEQRFAMVVQRFRWEVAEQTCQRVECGVRIDGVRAVRSRGFNRRDGERRLALLTMTLDDGGLEQNPDMAAETAGTTAMLRLHFADGADIELTLGAWLCTLEDRGAPWEVHARPCHALADLQDP